MTISHLRTAFYIRFLIMHYLLSANHNYQIWRLPIVLIGVSLIMPEWKTEAQM